MNAPDWDEATWLAMPDDLSAKVAEWQDTCPNIVDVKSVKQYTGHEVYAVTVTGPGASDDRKAHVSVVPHAHEPGATAGAMDFLNALITGYHLNGREWSLDRDEVLATCVMSLIPDGNPDGRSRAPVKWYDGSTYTNDEFWCIMRGKDRETGKMWKRLDHWSTEEETDHPEVIGIVYEQISPTEYVEPNRTKQSSMYKLIQMLHAERDYHQRLGLHQAELQGFPDNKCYAILPCLQDELPEERQQANVALAEAVIRAWQQAGGVPIPEPRPLGYTGEQRQYFIDTWGDMYYTSTVSTSEVQNNNPQTPAAEQMRLTEVAVTAATEHLMTG
jgi:hypothetical protein